MDPFAGADAGMLGCWAADLHRMCLACAAVAAADEIPKDHAFIFHFPFPSSEVLSLDPLIESSRGVAKGLESAAAILI